MDWLAATIDYRWVGIAAIAYRCLSFGGINLNVAGLAMGTDVPTCCNDFVQTGTWVGRGMDQVSGLGRQGDGSSQEPG